MKLAHVIAKIIRIITIPPLLALLLMLYLYFGTSGYFSSISELIIVGVCIVIVPTLGYPVCFAVPKLRALGREGERKMAFVMTGLGYALLVIPTVFCGFSEKLKIVCVTYVLSVIMLIFFNKCLKVKASGHACGVFGPLLVFVYVGGVMMLAPCTVLLALTVWSSVKLGRHTPTELFLGGACSAISLAVSMILFYFI